MSFQQTVNANPHLAGTVAQLKSALTTTSYSQNPDQVFDNMDQDPLIDAVTMPGSGRPPSRHDFLQYLNVAPPPIGFAVSSFCRTPAHQLRGPTLPDRLLGRVQRFTAVLNSVTGPRSSLSRTTAQNLIRDGTARVPGALARQKVSFKGYKLSAYFMWSYPPKDPLDPYQDIGPTRAIAVNTLGLGYFEQDPVGKTEVLLRWVHELPSATARQPTAWDASSADGNVYWRPGGKTFTLNPGAPGLTEVIHEPVEGQVLVAPMEELK